MKEMLTLISVVAVAVAIWLVTLSLWYLREQSDKKLLDSNAETIKSLQASLQTKDDFIAKNKTLLDTGNTTIKSLQDAVQAKDDAIGKDKALLDSKDETIKSLQSDLQAKEVAIGKDKADLDAKDDIIAKNLAALDAKDDTIKSLQGTIASYEEQVREIAQANEDKIIEKIYPKDNGFDAQDLGTGFFSYQYFGKTIVDPNHNQQPDRIPNHTPWTFSGNAGIGANNSGFYVSNATNRDSDGTTSTVGQAGFLQGEESSISQLLTLPVGTYTITFDYEGRRDYTSNEVTVSIDDTVLFKGTPTDTNTFKKVTTNPISLKVAGKHNLMFRGTNGDTSFIDNICINRIDPKKSNPDKGGDKTAPGKAHRDGGAQAVAEALK